MHFLPKNLGALAAIANNKSHRFALDGVRVELGDGKYTAVATDAKILVSVTGIPLPEGVIPAAMAGAPNGESVAIVGAKGWKKAFSGKGNVAVVVGKEVTTLGNGGDVATVDNIAHRDGSRRCRIDVAGAQGDGRNRRRGGNGRDARGEDRFAGQQHRARRKGNRAGLELIG